MPVPGLRDGGGGSRGRCCRTARAGKNFLRHVAKDPAGRYLDSIAIFQADERAALYADGARAALASSAEARAGAPLRSVRARCRTTAG